MCFLPVRKTEDGFEYVYVDENGAVRELSREEKGYLKETFDPANVDLTLNLDMKVKHQTEKFTVLFREIELLKK